jgi:hypothetical protein
MLNFFRISRAEQNLCSLEHGSERSGDVGIRLESQP